MRTCTWGDEADFPFIPDEQMSTLRPHLLLGTGGVRLQVRARDVERAREVLEAVEE